MDIYHKRLLCLDVKCLNLLADDSGKNHCSKMKENCGGKVTRRFEILVCFERIACDKESERIIGEQLQNIVYQAWQKAKKDIFKTWQEQTDPRNLEPDVRPLFRRVAEHLREHQPQDLT